MPINFELSGERLAFTVINNGAEIKPANGVGDVEIKFRGELWELDFVSSESYPGWNKTVFEYSKKEN